MAKSQVFNGTEAGTISLGNASGLGSGKIVLQVTAYTSGSLTPTARFLGSGATPIAVPYTDRPGNIVRAATTGINALGLFDIPADGVEIVLTNAAFIGTIWWIPVET